MLTALVILCAFLNKHPLVFVTIIKALKLGFGLKWHDTTKSGSLYVNYPCWCKIGNIDWLLIHNMTNHMFNFCLDTL